MTNQPDILKADIHGLAISRSLLHLLEGNHFRTIKELLDYPMEDWFEFTGFNQHLLNELMNFLDNNSLVPLVKD